MMKAVGEDKDNISTTTLAYFEEIHTSSLPQGIQEVTNAIPTQYN